MKIVLSDEARATLVNLRDQKMALRLRSALNELEKKGIQCSNVKKLTGIKHAYRKRVGRYRMLFTIDSSHELIRVWIIAVEKDTEKDYRRWTDGMR